MATPNQYILKGVYTIMVLMQNVFIVDKLCFASGGTKVLYPSIFSREMIYLGPSSKMIEILYEK